MKKLGAKIGDPAGEAVFDIYSLLISMRRRIDQLEREQLKFCGVYQSGRTYKANSLVIRQGGLWCALTNTPSPPGASADWQLAVKSGEVR